MKKPPISLAAIARIDAGPLLKALEIYQKAAGEIVSARFRLGRLKKEIDGFLEKTDPDDEKALSEIAGKRIQMEIIPDLIAKIERTIDEKLLPSVEKEFDRFQRRLIEYYTETRNSYAGQLAEMLRPFYSDITRAGDRVDFALELALQSDDCNELFLRCEAAQRITRPSSRSLVSIERDGKAICEATEKLVTLAKQ